MSITNKITILSVPEVEKKDKYSLLKVNYRTEEGKVSGKNVMSFGSQKDAFKALSAAAAGDVYEVTAEKNDKGYWDWISAKKVGHSEVGSGGGKTTSNPGRSSYETPEERFQRQVYIIRQSSLSTSVEMLNHVKKGYDVQEVLNLAKTFEEYVFGKGITPNNSSKEEEAKDKPTFNPDDDIPV